MKHEFYVNVLYGFFTIALNLPSCALLTYVFQVTLTLSNSSEFFIYPIDELRVTNS